MVKSGRKQCTTSKHPTHWLLFHNCFPTTTGCEAGRVTDTGPSSMQKKKKYSYAHSLKSKTHPVPGITARKINRFKPYPIIFHPGNHVIFPFNLLCFSTAQESFPSKGSAVILFLLSWESDLVVQLASKTRRLSPELDLREDQGRRFEKQTAGEHLFENALSHSVDYFLSTLVFVFCFWSCPHNLHLDMTYTWTSFPLHLQMTSTCRPLPLPALSASQWFDAPSLLSIWKILPFMLTRPAIWASVPSQMTCISI